ncbi:MAG: sugar ABC transporter permease [Lachnospiraceae bacterium]|nr:sugar ABC transporter permease [Lachnospiraceae bacterium]MCR4754523.1 ABC transporter permease subunit [Lachnospiraceae bacterium]
MARNEKKEKKGTQITLKEIKRQWFLMLVAAVVVIYGIIFYYWPLTGWIMAFEQYKPKTGLLHSKFIGLDKFRFLFEDDVFVKTIRNTFAMGVINLVTTTIMAVLFAIILNEVRRAWVKKPIQTISYLPHFLSWIVVTSILHVSLSPTGIINDLLLRFGFIKQAINFFAFPKYFWPIVAFANCWKETGWNAIIYLAAITAIDPALYEAASIDGADRLQKIRYITFPGIKPTFLILLLMNVGNVLNAGFEVQYLLGNGLVQSVSQTIDIYVLKWGISQNDFSLGTAAGLFKSAVSIAIIVIANSIAKRYSEQRLF